MFFNSVKKITFLLVFVISSFCSVFAAKPPFPIHNETGTCYADAVMQCLFQYEGLCHAMATPSFLLQKPSDSRTIWQEMNELWQQVQPNALSLISHVSHTAAAKNRDFIMHGKEIVFFYSLLGELLSRPEKIQTYSYVEHASTPRSCFESFMVISTPTVDNQTHMTFQYNAMQPIVQLEHDLGIENAQLFVVPELKLVVLINTQNTPWYPHQTNLLPLITSTWQHATHKRALQANFKGFTISMSKPGHEIGHAIAYVQHAGTSYLCNDAYIETLSRNPESLAELDRAIKTKYAHYPDFDINPSMVFYEITEEELAEKQAPLTPLLHEPSRLPTPLHSPIPESSFNFISVTIRCFDDLSQLKNIIPLSDDELARLRQELIIIPAYFKEDHWFFSQYGLIAIRQFMYDIAHQRNQLLPGFVELTEAGSLIFSVVRQPVARFSTPEHIYPAPTSSFRTPFEPSYTDVTKIKIETYRDLNKLNGILTWEQVHNIQETLPRIPGTIDTHDNLTSIGVEALRTLIASCGVNC